MRLRVWAATVATIVGLLTATPRVALAQEAPNYEQLRKMHEDSVRELRAAQDRKNQLSAEVDDLKKQLAAARSEVDELRRTDAEYAERTFYLRSHNAAWRVFANQRPDLLQEWRTFLQSATVAAPRDADDVTDPDWPLSIWKPLPRVKIAPVPSTAPSTNSTTGPATLPDAGPATLPTTMPSTAPAPSTLPASAPATGATPP